MQVHFRKLTIFLTLAALVLPLMFASPVSAASYTSPLSLPRSADEASSEDEAQVADVCLGGQAIALRIGESFTLTQGLPRELRAQDSLKFTSSNARIVRVTSRGKVLAVGGGTAKVTATTADGKKFVCGVSVSLTHTHFYQGDKKWDLPYSVKKRLCVTSSYAMVINNLGIGTDPERLYKKLPYGNVYQESVENAYPVRHVRAISANSKYYSSYSNGRTYIKNPGKNYVAAVKKALAANPEGVIVYFRRGSSAHAAVAVGVNKRGEIIYDDAGRTADKAHNAVFADTWLGKVGYSYSNLEYIVALDRA